MSVASHSTRQTARYRRPNPTRWGQLIFGIICMVMIANLQYGWTLFVTPIDQKYHWGRAAIQVAFTIFVLTETWLVPFEGYLIDKFGPRADGQRQRRSGRARLVHELDRRLAARCCMSPPRSAASAPASFTAARWATRSNGSPTGAALRLV